MVAKTDIAGIINSNLLNPRLTWTNITIDKQKPYQILMFNWTRYTYTEVKRGGGFVHWKCKLLKGFDKKTFDYERIYELSFGKDMMLHALSGVPFDRKYNPDIVYDCKMTFHKMSATNIKILKIDIIGTNEVFVPKVKETKQEDEDNEYHKKIV